MEYSTSTFRVLETWLADDPDNSCRNLTVAVSRIPAG